MVGPGISARSTWMVRPERLGITATISTSTPMPPIQWVKLRQKSMEWDMASTSRRTEAPVVVKPETVSKKASTKLGISPLIMKGRAPSTDTLSQARAVIRKPSLANMTLLSVRKIRQSRRPRPSQRAMVMRKGTSPLSP